MVNEGHTEKASHICMMLTHQAAYLFYNSYNDGTFVHRTTQMKPCICLYLTTPVMLNQVQNQNKRLRHMSNRRYRGKNLCNGFFYTERSTQHGKDKMV